MHGLMHILKNFCAFFIFCYRKISLRTQFNGVPLPHKKKKAQKFYTIVNRSAAGENIKLQHGFKIPKVANCSNHENGLYKGVGVP
jgi:hypothetical protein